MPRPVEPLQPVANLPAAADDVSEEDAEGEEEEDDLHGEAREDEDDDEDEECDSAELECFKDLCSQTCSKCSSQDGSKTRSLPLSENHRRCFCDPPCRSTHFPFEAWEGNLNHVPLQDLKETVKKMDGQRYWNGENEKKFSFLETEKVLDDFLDVRNWGQPIGGPSLRFKCVCWGVSVYVAQTPKKLATRRPLALWQKAHQARRAEVKHCWKREKEGFATHLGCRRASLHQLNLAANGITSGAFAVFRHATVSYQWHAVHPGSSVLEGGKIMQQT